jgi:putative NIF3 family GTP cyclohydrolase 1 type 2
MIKFILLKMELGKTVVTQQAEHTNWCFAMTVDEQYFAYGFYELETTFKQILVAIQLNNLKCSNRRQRLRNF